MFLNKFSLLFQYVVIIFRYHEWMKSAELQYFTGSESLTLEEEFQMQKRWHQDQDSE